jgi:hypothetical protein
MAKLVLGRACGATRGMRKEDRPRTFIVSGKCSELGKKRHILVDTLGLPPRAIVHTADIKAAI